MDSLKEQIKITQMIMSDDIIGTGSYGVVKKGYTLNNVECAVKITHPILIKMSPKKSLLSERMLHEAEVMNKLGIHRNLVRFIGLHFPFPNESKDSEDHPPYLVMELCHKRNLRSCLEDDTLRDLQTRHKILHDAAQGLEYIHSCRYIHCDLTPNNILITKDLHAKIGDFGAAKSFNESITDYIPGTPAYMGPEVKETPCSYTEKLDIYSFGCILLFTVTGKEHTDDIEAWLVDECILQFPLLQELAKQCLQRNPQKRPTAGEICYFIKQSTILKADTEQKQGVTLFKKKIHLNILQDDRPTSYFITKLFSSSALDSFRLNERMLKRFITRPCDGCRLPYSLKFQPKSNTDGKVKDACQNKKLSVWLNHTQAVLVSESISENTNHTFPCNDVAKPCTTMSCKTAIFNDDAAITVAVLMYCLWCSLKSLLFVAASSNQKCETIRPCISARDDHLPEVQNMCSEPDTSVNEVHPPSLPLSCHEDHFTSGSHDKGNDKRLQFDNSSLSGSNVIPKVGIKSLKFFSIVGFIILLVLFVFCLQSSFPNIKSFFANGLNKPRCTLTSWVVLCQSEENYPPVVTHNDTRFKTDIDKLSASSCSTFFCFKKQVYYPKCRLQDARTKNTNSSINDNGLLLNYSANNATLLEKEYLHLASFSALNLFEHCLQFSFLCDRSMHQFVNASKYNLFRSTSHQLNHANNPLVITKHNNISMLLSRLFFTSSVVHKFNVYFNKQYIKNQHCGLQDQHTNITWSTNSFICDARLLLNSSTVKARTSEEGYPFRKAVENAYLDSIPQSLTTLSTMHATLPDHCLVCNQTMYEDKSDISNISLFVPGDGYTNTLINSRVLTIYRLTGTLESNNKQCFSKAMAYNHDTVQSLLNDTCYLSTNRQVETNCTSYKSLEAVPFNVTLMVNLPTMVKLLPFCIDTHFPNVKCKFKSKILQHWLYLICALIITLYIFVTMANENFNKLHCTKAIFISPLKNPTYLCDMNQQTIERYKQQIVIYYVCCLKHRQSSNSWYIIYQEITCHNGQPHKKSTYANLGYYIINLDYWISDIFYVKLVASFAAMKHLSCKQISLMLFKLTGNHTCIVLPPATKITELITELKTRNNIFCKTLTSSEVLQLTNQSGKALADSKLKNNADVRCVTMLVGNHSQYSFENQSSQCTQVKNHQEVTLGMNALNMFHSRNDQSCCGINNKTDDNRQVNSCIVHDLYDSTQYDEGDDHSGNLSDYDHDDDHNDGNNAEHNDHNIHNDDGNNDDDHNHNEDDQSDNHNHNEGDQSDDDHNHNEDNQSDDQDHNEDGCNGNDQNHNDDSNDNNDDNDFALILNYYLLLLLGLTLSFLYLCLAGCRLLTSTIQCQVWHVIRRRTRIACIGNKIYHNTFRPSCPLILIRVQITDITIASARAFYQRHLYLFRSRYSQYTMLHNRLFTNVDFQVLPLCYNETTNFQTLWFVNDTITHSLNALQFEDQSLMYCQGNAPVMLSNTDEKMHSIFLRIRRRQSLVLLWQCSYPGFHKTFLLTNCRVEHGKCNLIITAIIFEKLNNVKRVKISTTSWLKQMTQIFCLCGNSKGIISSLTFRTLDQQLLKIAKKLFVSDRTYKHITCTMRILRVQNPLRHDDENTVIVCNKSIKQPNHLFMNDTFDAVVPINVLQSDDILHNLVYNLYLHALSLQVEDNWMLLSCIKNIDCLINAQNIKENLTEIQFGIFPCHNNQFEVHQSTTTLYVQFSKVIINNNMTAMEVCKGKLVYQKLQLRCIRICTQDDQGLTRADIVRAEEAWIVTTQEGAFVVEIRLLRKSGPVTSLQQHLNLYFDSKGIICYSLSTKLASAFNGHCHRLTISNMLFITLFNRHFLFVALHGRKEAVNMCTHFLMQLVIVLVRNDNVSSKYDFLAKSILIHASPHLTKILEHRLTIYFLKQSRAIQQNLCYPLRRFIHDDTSDNNCFYASQDQIITVECTRNSRYTSQLVIRYTTACQTKLLGPQGSSEIVFHTFHYYPTDDSSEPENLVSGCTIERLEESTEDAKLVAACTAPNVSSYPIPSQQLSTPNFGNVQSKHIMPFPSVNPPMPGHQCFALIPLEDDTLAPNQDMTPHVIEDDEMVVPQPSNSVTSFKMFYTSMGPKNSERTVFEHEITGKLLPYSVEVTEKAPTKASLVSGNTCCALIHTVIQLRTESNSTITQTYATEVTKEESFQLQ